MLPPTVLGLTSPHVLPSNQQAVQQAISPPTVSPGQGAESHAAGSATVGLFNEPIVVAGTGPGPLRHPRPLTAADLHLQLEKEQEAVVNRLTRELSMLRAAQNASVVSNTSSTSASAGLPDPSDHGSSHLLSGPSHPVPSQRAHHRSSSSTSARSATGSLGTVGVAGSSGVLPDRSRPTAIPRQESNTMPTAHSMSRQNSATGSRRSGASSPALFGSAPSSYQHEAPHIRERYPSQRDQITSSASLDRQGAHDNTHVTSGRYEEAAFQRQELDIVKRENELLKRRIRELERTLRTRRRESDVSASASASAGAAGRNRSESASTTASVGQPASSHLSRDLMGVAGARSRETLGRESEEDGVRVGESARSVGLP